MTFVRGRVEQHLLEHPTWLDVVSSKYAALIHQDVSNFKGV